MSATTSRIHLLAPPLPARDATTAGLARHPDDGWVQARPIRMGKRLRIALHGLIRAMLPPEPAPQLDDAEGLIEDYLRHFFAYTTPLARFAFRLSLLCLDFGPLWRFTSFRRLHAMDRERASEILRRMQHSRLGVVRDMVLFIRATILSAYFDQTEVHRAMGYAPTPFMRRRIALHDRIVAGERYAEDDLLMSPEELPEVSP